MVSPGVTLPQFLIEQPQQSQREFYEVLKRIAAASKIISHEITRSALVNLSGLTGEVNVHGEAVKKLGQFTNSVLVPMMEESRLVGSIASEEMEEVLRVPGDPSGRKYSVLLDPLDGSSNADINGLVGTIFSIQPFQNAGDDQSFHQTFLRKGSEQLAAGYIMYGPSTVLVFSAGEGVHGFTLDPNEDEYIYSHPDIRMPERGSTYAINHGNRTHWSSSTEKLVEHFSEQDESTHRPYSQRWVGSLTADFHRILLEGGLYLYPEDKKRPQGKLRLLYECAPLAFIARPGRGKSQHGKRANPGHHTRPTTPASAVDHRQSG